MNTDRMRKAFDLFDPDGAGKITKEGLQKTLKTLNKATTDEDMRMLIGNNVDGLFTERDGKIDYETFVAIYNGELRHAKEPITDLQEAFRLLDPDQKGHIDSSHLQRICRKLGEDLSEEEVKAMVHEALIGYDGRIFYDGLLKILITQ
eukprot:CAMPEP_0174700596 /NCGR_PEP_ID=MMETSP1094-20130205/5505_1 /TAXON_ID=156173 /ORGANISM="Chrysochromulina brevifilum, Strain UTEX LB 985" /LENGTH=147 /DNA_ID=CAMNT_0015898107 /DNA_START=132 /DNA_END=575 /DNA_ORIENTATION=-